MLNTKDIYETIEMIDEHRLDVRTITMAISLFDCISRSKEETAARVYEKVYDKAKDLVSVGNRIGLEYGIPIVNKRVSVSPVSLIGSASGGYAEIAKALDKAAQDIGIDFLGGYTALVHKGMTGPERDFIETIPYALKNTRKVCASVNVGATKSGINFEAVRLMGEKILQTAEITKEEGCIGCAKLVVFCNAVEDNPFMAGAFNGVGEGDAVINVGVSGPGVVEHAIRACGDAPIDEIAEVIKKTAFKITRVGQLVAIEAAKRLNAQFGIVDLSLAPTPNVGDSVAHILEAMGVGTVGGVGTTACLAILNDAVKKGGIMASSSVGGLSGAFIPVSEDIGMINAAKSGRLTIEKLEAMTSVCSVGLDMIAVPGDVTADAISALIADESAIGMINNKTTAVRVIPAIGKKEGDFLDFGGLLGSAPVMNLRDYGAERLVRRGGRVPAPIHSNKN